MVIEAPHHHRQCSPAFHGQIDLRLAGGAEIVVKPEPSERLVLAENSLDVSQKGAGVNVPRKDAHITVNDAFEIAHRRMEDHVRRARKQGLHVPLAAKDI